MRFSKRRKITEPMARVNVHVPVPTREKLEKIAGRHSLGYAIEALVEREARRREKKEQEKLCVNCGQPKGHHCCIDGKCPLPNRDPSQIKLGEFSENSVYELPIKLMVQLEDSPLNL